MATVTLAFWISFTVTLALLVTAIVTGFRGRRRLHLWIAPASLAALAVAIVLAVMMGRTRVFPEQAMRIHKVIATTATCLALPVIVTGLLLLRDARWRMRHRVCVIAFIALALSASGTGVWVFTQSVPR